MNTENLINWWRIYNVSHTSTLGWLAKDDTWKFLPSLCARSKAAGGSCFRQNYIHLLAQACRFPCKFPSSPCPESLTVTSARIGAGGAAASCRVVPHLRRLCSVGFGSQTMHMHDGRRLDGKGRVRIAIERAGKRVDEMHKHA